MNSVFNDIFGGSTQQSSSTPTNMNPLTGVIAPGLGSYITGLLQKGAPQYNGPLQPNMTAAQQTTLNQLPGMVGPGSNVADYVNQVLAGNYMPGGPNGNPFLQAAVQAGTLPIKEQLDQTLSTILPSNYMAAGQNVGPNGSSAFAKDQAMAVTNAANAEATVATNVANNAYNTGVQQQTAAATLQPQLVQSTINTLQAQLLPTLLQEQGITNGLQAFQENVSSLMTFLQAIGGIASPVVGNNATSTGSSTPGILPDVTNLFRPSGKSQQA